MDIVYDPLLGKPRMDDVPRVKAPPVDQALDASSRNAVSNSAVTVAINEARGTAVSAKTAAEEAKADAADAKTTSGVAKAEAGAAKSAAREARTGASGAKTVAGEAKVDAAVAKTGSEEAKTAAAGAQKAAGEARADATGAKADAAGAKTMAGEAKVSAEAAKADAGAAKTSADAAKAAADASKRESAEAKATAEGAKSKASSAETAALQAKSIAQRAETVADTKTGAAEDVVVSGNWTRLDRGKMDIDLFQDGMPVGRIYARGGMDSIGNWLDVDFDPFAQSDDFMPDYTRGSLHCELPGYVGSHFEGAVLDPETYEPGTPVYLCAGECLSCYAVDTGNETLAVTLLLDLSDDQGRHIGMLEISPEVCKDGKDVSVYSGSMSPRVNSEDGQEYLLMGNFPEPYGRTGEGDEGKSVYRPAATTPFATTNDLAIHDEATGAHAARFSQALADCLAWGLILTDKESGGKSVAEIGPDRRAGSYIAGGWSGSPGTPSYQSDKDLVLSFMPWFDGRHGESPVYDIYIPRPTGYINSSLANPAIFIRARTSMNNTAAKDYEVARFSRKQEDRYAYEIIHLQVMVTGISNGWPDGKYKNIRLLRRERAYSNIINYQHGSAPQLGTNPCFSECVFSPF